MAGQWRQAISIFPRDPKALDMIRSFQIILVAGLLMAGQKSPAFSLLGPFDEWQVPTIGYQLPGDIGAVQNLGEEYRLQLTVMTYGFDESFLNYFGQDGVRAVEEAIAILNDLPPVSQTSSDLTEYPLDTRRFNFRATALHLNDLKSYALSTLLGQMGLAGAERWVWTLRARVVLNNVPFYTVMKRNFDPVTWMHSSYVNGALYSYTIQETYPSNWEAVEVAVDPFSPAYTSVSILEGLSGGTVDSRVFSTFSPGMFYTGLTRDDVGGLRYIYRALNVNVEAPSPDATLASGFAGGGGSPYAPAQPAPDTTEDPDNGDAAAGQNRNTSRSTAATGDPYRPADPDPGTGTTGPVFVQAALRPGIEKVNFVRAEFDSKVGAFITRTNFYNDRFITNSSSRFQVIQRVLQRPDILFGAADLGVDVNGFPFIIRRTATFDNNDDLNGAVELNGPGVIQPGIEILFSKIGPFFRNTRETDEAASRPFEFWGSFDGTTNDPIIYPNSISITELEEQILRGGR